METIKEIMNEVVNQGWRHSPGHAWNPWQSTGTGSETRLCRICGRLEIRPTIRTVGRGLYVR